MVVRGGAKIEGERGREERNNINRKKRSGGRKIIENSEGKRERQLEKGEEEERDAQK